MQICQGCLTLLKKIFEPSRGVWGDEHPQKILKILCLKLHETASVASLDTDKRKGDN